jgi:hypothetical protein
MGGNNSYATSNDGAPAFFDDIAISSASSMSNVDTSPLHVASVATPFNEQHHFMSTSNNTGRDFEQVNIILNNFTTPVRAFCNFKEKMLV